MATSKEKKIMRLMTQIRDRADWWIGWVSNVNEDAATDKTLEKVAELAAEMKQIHESRFS